MHSIHSYPFQTKGKNNQEEDPKEEKEKNEKIGHIKSIIMISLTLHKFVPSLLFSSLELLAFQFPLRDELSLHLSQVGALPLSLILSKFIRVQNENKINKC